MSSELEQSVRDLKGSVETLIRMYEICKESRMPPVPVILDSYYFVKNGTLCKLTDRQNAAVKKLTRSPFEETKIQVGNVTLAYKFIVDDSTGYQGRGQGYTQPQELFIQLRAGGDFYVVHTLNMFINVKPEKDR